MSHKFEYNLDGYVCSKAKAKQKKKINCTIYIKYIYAAQKPSHIMPQTIDHI